MPLSGISWGYWIVYQELLGRMNHNGEEQNRVEESRKQQNNNEQNKLEYN